MRHIKGSGHTRERPGNSWQDKHSRHRSHYKSSSRYSKTDFESSPNQLSSESYRRLKSSAENGKSRMSSKHSRSLHHGYSYSRSRDHQSSHRTNRSKSRSSSKHSRRSVSKVSTLDQSYSSLDSPSPSEQYHESHTSENSPSKSSKVSHKEHHLLSKSFSKSGHKHCTSSQSHKKHKRSKSHKHHHHSRDKSAPKDHVEDGSKKSPTYLGMIHQPSKSVHLESDSELGADKEDKDTYSRRNEIGENLSTNSDVESAPLSSGVDKCLTDHQLHQEGDDVEEQYDCKVTKKMKKR